MSSHREERIRALCRDQLGLVTRAQVLATGLGRSSLSRRVAAGDLVPCGARTFRHGAVAPTAEGRVLAACLDRGGVASHRTAAWLHGFAPHPGVVEITVPKGRSVYVPPEGRRSLIVHTSTDLPADDLIDLGAVPTTSVARTCLDLAALVPSVLGAGRLLDLVSTAVDRDLATDPWLWWLLARRRRRGRNGVRALEEALANRSRVGPTESWLEREVLRILGAASIRLPQTQRVVRADGRFAARVDFLYEPERVVVEALGYAFHRTPAQMEADTRRANALQLSGFAVLQFTTRQVVTSPDSVVATVAGALRSAAGNA